MTFDSFELAVIELASRGVRLTVTNVAANLHVAPAKAEEWLDQMAREGRLDLELDEVVGLVFYRVRGLTPPPRDIVVPSARPTPPALPREPRGQKSTALAAALGLLLPGAGLVYAAPVSAAAVVGLFTLVAVKMLAAFPLLGPLLSSIGLGLCALASGVLGLLYARQYNRHGRRTHLAPSTRRALIQQAATTFAHRP
ncbi:MAG TPA: hypothetical protein ENK57_16355 [Polyangiaceae bacterium]|nr:hypothetical protein [Polyangiaceae bacterium]